MKQAHFRLCTEERSAIHKKTVKRKQSALLKNITFGKNKHSKCK